uniref:Uncharacterized protein n=1 Tax=Dicentrarchus labrax TaxID=13489 RepID=A0A8C4GWC2_DICLA
MVRLQKHKGLVPLGFFLGGGVSICFLLKTKWLINHNPKFCIDLQYKQQMDDTYRIGIERGMSSVQQKPRQDRLLCNQSILLRPPQLFA